MATISFVGAADLMIDETDPDFMLEHVASQMRDADLTYVNLEGPMCDVGEKNPALLGIASAIKSAPRVAPALKRAGVDVVSLSNNHTMDYGPQALAQTIGLLRDNDIRYCGAGSNLQQARSPVVLETGGVRVAFLSYTSVCPPSYAATEDGPGAAYVRASTSYEGNLRLFLQPGSPMAIRTHAHPGDLERVKAEVAAAKAQADAVIVSWHWGVSERWGKISEYQREMGRAAIDSGASAILGHHAHLLLGVEHYHGCPIFYSLGNFAFDKWHPSFLPETALVKCDISSDGRLSNLHLQPLLINDKRQPVPAQGLQAHRIAWILEDQSHAMNTRFSCDGSQIVLSAIE